MTKTVYHITPAAASEREFCLCRDFGPGLPCTEDLPLAQRWAAALGRDAAISHCTLETDGLSFLDLSAYSVLHWVAVLLQHRVLDLRGPLAAEGRDYLLAHYALDTGAYDIISGYAAAGSFFSFAQDFLNGSISCRQLQDVLRLGNPGRQLVLKSAAARERLHAAGEMPAVFPQWDQAFREQDLAARALYSAIPRQRGDLFILDILDQEVRPDDPRLR